MKHIATLSNNADIISFAYNDIVIKFRGPYSLQYFSKVNTYDDGYIEVMCKFAHDENLIEDYIDLENIATELYMNTDFLKEIEGVECKHV